MGLDMFLYRVPKVEPEVRRDLEKRLSKAYFEKTLDSEVAKVQEELKFKNPIKYEVLEWVSAENYEEFNKSEHCPKISLLVEIGYWRKFNALHAWFVNTVQDGNDDCDNYPVSLEQLQELLYSLANINKDNAEEILPSKSGFFFGGTEYDEWYFQAVDELKLFIMNLVEEHNPDEEGLIYSSSW